MRQREQRAMEEERLRIKNLSLKQQSIYRKEATHGVHQEQNRVGCLYAVTKRLEIQRVHPVKGKRRLLEARIRFRKRS
jgi:hypothetical protein